MTFRRRRFGAGRLGAALEGDSQCMDTYSVNMKASMVSDFAHLLRPSHMHIKVCSAGADARIADATTRSEQRV